MRLGLMNHPAFPVADELRRIAAAGYDFVDLTLEPPCGWPVPSTVGETLGETGLSVVGHTAWYLPIASPFPELREPVRAMLREQFQVFAALGARLVNLHPDPMNSMYPVDEVRRRNADAVELLAEDAREHGISVMVENLGRTFSRVDELAPIFERVPEAAAFHLDIGHANMLRARGEPNRTVALIEAFGDRLAHVHVHDNVGGDDLHLPVGAGTIPWADVVGALKRAGYDGTVTFEVFRVPDDYVDASRRLWLEWWEAA